jgi:dynein heavy chain
MSKIVFLFLQFVAARSEKIGEEEEKCRVMAEQAQHDLDEALPALAEAMKVV